jgi:single-strand DNA-binding protein
VVGEQLTFFIYTYFKVLIQIKQLKNISMKNQVRLIGNIGKDTAVTPLQNGNAVGKASIAISEKYKNAKGELVETTEWVNLEFWGKNAENAGKLLKKGAGVIIDGSIKTDSYENKDGVKMYATKVVVSEFVVTTYVTEKAAA